MEVLHCSNKALRPFCSFDLDLDPVTFIYELNLYSLEIHRMRGNKIPTLKLSKFIVWHIHTYTHTYIHIPDRNYIPRRFAVGQKFSVWACAFLCILGGESHFVFCSCVLYCTLQGDPKMAPFLYALTLPNINRFSKLVYCQMQQNEYNHRIESYNMILLVFILLHTVYDYVCVIYFSYDYIFSLYLTNRLIAARATRISVLF